MNIYNKLKFAKKKRKRKKSAWLDPLSLQVHL